MQALTDSLSHFDPEVRRQALLKIAAAAPPPPAETDRFNMHLHTFFSFNGEDWSPSRLVWEARARGLCALAICDFDVLDGLEELLAAADLLGVRAAAGFESRTFFREYANDEINSPGEPGVFYFMGMGFVTPPAAGTPAGAVLADMLERSHERNRDLIARINGALGTLAVRYEDDVIPLTPRGNATERHIVRAYQEKALALAGGDFDRATAFWAAKLGTDSAAIAAKIRDTNAFADLLRSKLMKKGGVGYRSPDETTFPLLDNVIGMIKACRAIPMSTWLDGTSSGESDPESQLECLVAKGIGAVNIIPDRNWNLKDPDEKQRKIAELDRYVAAAEALDLPVNIGTELNKPDQRFVDDFDAPAMKRHHATFLAGARVMVGHTRLLRYADLSYTDAKAVAEYPGRGDRNAFFAAVGALPAPGEDVRRKLTHSGAEAALTYLRESAAAGAWR